MKNELLNLIDLFEELTHLSKKNSEKVVNNLLKNKDQSLESLKKIQSSLSNLTKCKKCNSVINFDICKLCNDLSLKKVLLLNNNLEHLNLLDKTDNLYKIYIFEDLKSFLKNPSNSPAFQKLLDFLILNNIEELIFSMSPNLENDILYNVLLVKLKEKNPKLIFSKISIGIPFGGSIEYVDKKTYLESLKKRK